MEKRQMNEGTVCAFNYLMKAMAYNTNDMLREKAYLVTDHYTINFHLTKELPNTEYYKIYKTNKGYCVVRTYYDNVYNVHTYTIFRNTHTNKCQYFDNLEELCVRLKKYWLNMM